MGPLLDSLSTRSPPTLFVEILREAEAGVRYCPPYHGSHPYHTHREPNHHAERDCDAKIIQMLKYGGSYTLQQIPGKTGWLGQNVGLYIQRKAKPMLVRDDAG